MSSRQEIVLTALLTAAVTTMVISWVGYGRKDDSTHGNSTTSSEKPRQSNVVHFQSGQQEILGKEASIQAEKDNIHVPYHHERRAIPDIRSRAQQFLSLLRMRRTIRFFSSDPVPKDIMESIIQTACTAPSGAHKQPWSFVAISNPTIKKQIRQLVEQEETLNYQRRMRKTWVQDVEGMVSKLHGGDGDSVQKPYLTEAPWLIVVLKQPHGIDPKTNERIDHYYVQESVGIACGMLIAAIQNANLATLTSTPMGAEKGIKSLLGRPEHEKVVLLMPVGFPAKNATVPYRQQERKPLDEVLYWKC